MYCECVYVYAVMGKNIGKCVFFMFSIYVYLYIASVANNIYGICHTF